jgi:phytoene desaturase
MKLNIITTIDKYVARFFKTPIIQKIMQYTTVFLGTAPSQTPAFYNIMSHVDFAMGVRYPQGGLHAIATALVNIGKKYGVQYYTDSEVVSVEITDKKIHSFTLQNGKTITSDLVIVNADQARFETAMIPSEYQTYNKPYREKKTFAPSGFIIYAGIDKKLPQLEHHNLYFNENRAESF